jgi:glycosyltransferase involved in cell wall biosynthesis
VVTDGATGLLVPPGDAASLRRALVRVVIDRDEAARFGRAARASVLPRFGIDRYVSSVVNLYEQLLGEAGQWRPQVA